MKDSRIHDRMLKKNLFVSVEEYESLKETNEILSDPVLVKAIAEGEKDNKKRKVYDWDKGCQ